MPPASPWPRPARDDCSAWMRASIAVVISSSAPRARVLVDDRGPFAVVSHPGHQVPQPGAAYRRQVIPGVAKIVKVQAFGADRADRMRPGGHLVEVAPPQRPALDAGEQQGARGRRLAQQPARTGRGKPELWRPRAPPICDLNHILSGICRRPQAARSWRHAETFRAGATVPARELAEKPAQTGMAIAVVQGWHVAVHADCGSRRTRRHQDALRQASIGTARRLARLPKRL